MRTLLFALLTALVVPANAQVLSNLPPNTVVGRLGAGIAGPAQAIPFATLITQLQGVPGIPAVPGTTVSGDVVTWNSTSGAALSDSGVSLSGTGTITLGTLGAVTIASNKTLTDTSAIGANLLLGATTGGFAEYGGASACSAGSFVTALSTAGATTCTSAVASPTFTGTVTLPDSSTNTSSGFSTVLAKGTAFASLPGSPTAGMVAYVNDGKASNCGDSACTAWGTTVTGGTGSLKLLVWYNGTNWTLVGK